MAEPLKAKPTRGERDNNPMNIRQSADRFLGEVVPSRDPAFKQFETSKLGIRAGARILQDYYTRYGLNTVGQIIDRWTPPTENNTGSYISDVARLMGVRPNATLNMNDPAILAALVKAIIYHENGQLNYTSDEVLAAVALLKTTTIA